MLNLYEFSVLNPLGFSHRDMDFIQGLRWSLEEVSRAYGVPKPLLSDLERATFSNINTAERIFWRNTMVPEIQFMEEQLTRMLLPKLGYQDLEVEFDLTGIEVLREDENSRVSREAQLPGPGRADHQRGAPLPRTCPTYPGGTCGPVRLVGRSGLPRARTRAGYSPRRTVWWGLMEPAPLALRRSDLWSPPIDGASSRDSSRCRQPLKPRPISLHLNYR